MTFKDLRKSVSKKEKRYIWILVVILIVVTTAPYLYGWIAAEDGYFYTGMHRISPADFNVYFSYMEQAADGHLLFRDLYTSEYEPHNFFSPVWLVGGAMTKLGLSGPVVFQILRIISIPFLAFVLYWLVAYFLKEPRRRKVAYFISLFASGLGLYVFLGIGSKGLGSPYNYPLDIWVSEYNTFLTIFQTSHFIISLALILLTFLLLLLAWENNKMKYSLWAGVSVFFLLIIHPYHLPTIFVIGGAWLLYLLLSGKKGLFYYLKHLVIVGLFAVPPMAYFFWLWKTDYVFWLRNYANYCATPDWWITLSSYGLVLILAVVSMLFIRKNWKDMGDKYFFLISWALIQFFLIFAPFITFQRRLTEGLFIPLSILAAIGLYNLKDKINIKNKLLAEALKDKFLVAIVFAIFFFASNLYIYATDIYYFKNNVFFLYLPNDAKQAYNWIEENTEEDSVFISSCFMGNYLPAYSGRIVYCGHGNETNFYEVKKARTQWFFDDNTDLDKKLKFAKEEGIDYVFYSEYPGNLEEDPVDLEFLENTKYFKLVFDSEQIQVYELINFDY